MKKNSLILILILLICLLGLTLLSQHSIKTKVTEEENRIKQRNALQEIIDSTSNNDSIFNSSLKGKIVVLNISLPFMGAAKRQEPGLSKLATDFKTSNNIVFIAVLPIDSGKYLKRMEGVKLPDNYKIVYNSRVLPYLARANLIEDTHSSPLPVNIVFNKEGKIELSYLGDKPEAPDEIRNYLSSLPK